MVATWRVVPLAGEGLVLEVAINFGMRVCSCRNTWTGITCQGSNTLGRGTGPVYQGPQFTHPGLL